MPFQRRDTIETLCFFNFHSRAVMGLLMISAFLILTHLGSSRALHGYYSVDHWFNAQSDYQGYYDPTFYLNVARFIPFSEMEDKRFRDCAFGFPKGVRGSALVPTIFYFVHFVIRNEKILERFRIPTQHQHIPIYLHWDKLLSTCNDSAVPLCSWSQFVSFADPFMIDLNALARLNPYLTTNMACTSQMGCPASLPLARRPSSSMYHLHLPLTLGNCYPIKSKAHTSLIYIFTVCYHYENHISRSPFLKKICPDPCRSQPCKDINFAVVCLPTGIFKDSFVCKCLDRYQWDPIARRCVLQNFCVEDSICDEDGTDRCEFNEVTGGKCVCLREYMGHDCSQQRDPCIHSDSGISGSDACNVVTGNNKCEPNKGTNHYICICGISYAADPNLPYDNCKKKLPPCARTLCIYGACKVTEDGNHGACVCDPDYKGPHCDIPRGSWGAWHAWTRCAPECSDDPQRRRVRDCIGETDDCIGVIEEVEQCASLYCPHGGNPEEVELESLNTVLVQTAQIGIISVLLGLAVLVALSGLSARKSKAEAQLAMMEARKRFEQEGSLDAIESREKRVSASSGPHLDWNW